MREVLGALALAALAGAAHAQEGGPIRTGEHSTFTRVVLEIEPTTEWSLETRDGAATLFIPGREITFSLAGAFAKIPRTRVTDIETAAGPDGTEVRLDLGCDCRVSASFVRGRFLALDVSDRDAPRFAAEDAPIPPLEPVPETPEARAARESGVVANAEDVLIQQLTRAADQGVVRLAPDAPTRDPEADLRAAAEAPPTGDAPPAPRQATALAEAEAEAVAQDGSAPVADAGPQPRPRDAGATGATPETLAELALMEQIEATTVFDRDSAALERAEPPAPEIPAPCKPDAALDVGRWTSGAPLVEQTPQLMRRIVGEFDQPDPRALRDLSRLYIRYGFGSEAGMLLDSFPADIADGDLLLDLARVMQDKPVSPDGPLAVQLACPGRHGLWLALGGAAPAYNDAAQFGTVQEAFGDLPVDMRAMLGPKLVNRLLDAGRPVEARLIQTTALRPGVEPTVDQRLAEARLRDAEGKTTEALVQLRALAESTSYNAVDALMAMSRIALDEGVMLPERTVTDLRAAALQQRGSEREGPLRGLLIEALAQRGALAEAMAETRAARADMPQSRDIFLAIAATVLGAADPDTVGPGPYAETVLTSGDLLSPDARDDGPRRAIAARLIEIGLPNAALSVLDPPATRGDAQALYLAARAHLALGQTQAALDALQSLQGPEATALRAATLARAGAPGEAMAVLEAAGEAAAAAPYAWPAGAWTRARAASADDTQRAAMATYMAQREAELPPPPPVDPATLTPETAFEAPLPPLAQPSLGAARDLLATGARVEEFVGEVIAGGTQDDPAAPEAAAGQ